MKNGSLAAVIHQLRHWAANHGVGLDEAKITLDIKTNDCSPGNGARAKNATLREVADLNMNRWDGSDYMRNGNLKLMGIEVEMYETRTVTTRSKL